MDGSISEAQQPLVTAEDVSSPLDLLKLIAVGRRRLPLIASVAILVLAVVVIYTFQQTPLYTATTQLVIDPRKENVVDIGAAMTGMPPDSTAIDTEVQVLKSRSLGEKVATVEKLNTDPEFNPALAKPSLISTLLRFGKATSPIASGPVNPVTALRQHQAVVDHALGGLKVQRLGLTYVIELSYTSESPAKAARLANAFANAYLTSRLDAKFDATKKANEWLNTKVDDLRQQVLDAETAVAQFKVANNLMSAQGETLTEQEISTLDAQVAGVRAQQAEADARLNTAKAQMARGSNGEDVGEALASPVVQSLRAQRSTTSQMIADLEGRYGERHPDLLKAKRQLADIDTQIQQAIQTIISNLEAQDQVARQRTASMEASVAKAKGALVGNSRDSVRLNELQRNADAAKALYESYLNRFKETSAQQGIEVSDARIVSEAKIPTSPSYPNKTSSPLMGFFLALAAGLAAAFIAERLDSGIGTAEDLERELDVSHLGSIPSLSSLPDTQKASVPSKTMPIDFVLESPLSSFSEAFRNLRASVLFSRLGQTVKVIAVTSALPGEGKTTTSVALARTMAISGARTVVVDCDLRQRGLNRMLTKEPAFGLLDLLNGTATLEQALLKDPSGAMVLPLAKSVYTPKDVFGTTAMKALLDELRRRFDVVILDTAPVLPIADTRVLAPMADAVVLLIRWRKTPRKAAVAALRLLKSTHAHVVGAALTQVDIKAQSRHGYGDPGYYYQSYRKYYVQ